MSESKETTSNQVTYGFVLLVKVVDISIKDLNKKFDRNSRVHASVSDSESSLQALQHTFAVSVEL